MSMLVFDELTKFEIILCNIVYTVSRFGNKIKQLVSFVDYNKNYDSYVGLLQNSLDKESESQKI